MKRMVLALSLVCLNVQANILTCDVTSPKDYSKVIFDMDLRSINTIDLQGASTARVFARWPLVRGPFTFTSCSPNINEYKNNMEAFLINARCSGGTSRFNVSFYTSLDPRTGGDMAFMKANQEYETVTFSNCK